MKESIFIHFLNRELYRAVGIEKFNGVNYILKIMLLCCGESLFIPLSSIWESVHVSDLDYDLFELFYNNKQVEVCSDCVTVDEFLFRNRNMYRFDEARYENIYFNTYKKLRKFLPTTVKTVGVTERLSESIDNWDNSIIVLPYKDRMALNENRSTIIRVNHEREDKALTISLFRDEILRKDDSYSIARFLSTTYINDYCQWLNADIITGINGGVFFFDILSKEYPYHDIRLFGFILYISGVTRQYIEERDIFFWDKLIELRGLFAMDDVHRMLYEIIDNSIIHVRNQNSNEISIRSICRFIKAQSKAVRIKEINVKDPNRFLERLKDNMQRICQAVCDKNSLILEPRVYEQKTKLLFKKFGFLQSGIDWHKKGRNNMKVFIVHGHENETKLELKNYVQNTLKLGEPIILAEKASGGLTIIEKFEKYASGCNLVFVLLTPDDVYGTEKRARQNVIFEMGYFLGKLGRKSGRVILLYKGDLDIPNDISGLIYINIDNGVEAAGEEIRREISTIV